MTHALLPQYKGEGSRSRFADTATELLIRRMSALGPPETLVARIFGGASMAVRFGLAPPEDPSRTIGGRNVAQTRAVLEAAKIRILEADVGGHFGKRIAFDVATGAVVTKRIPSLNSEAR